MMENSLLVDTATYAVCKVWNKLITEDGVGGYVIQWVAGATFPASIVSDVSTEAKVAATQGVRDTYTVYTDSGMILFHDTVFERLKDGKLFRVTSDGDEKQSPNSSPLRMRIVKAEEWSFPND